MTSDMFLTPGSVLLSLTAKSKKRLLLRLSEHAANAFSVDAGETLTNLYAREKLGSTGVGHGVAIPHARVERLDRVVGIFAALNQPLDFDAVDDTPVDLVFLLLAPKEEGGDHLKALSRVSHILRNADARQRLRGITNPQDVIEMFSEKP